jgi:hypothetical protein
MRFLYGTPGTGLSGSLSGHPDEEQFHPIWPSINSNKLPSESLK